MEFVNGGNYDFVNVALKNRTITKNSLSWLISDHYPLWAEFKI
jgi:endonuclease/exonuclease/phosphatase family metal-dependent hydrolase